MSTISSINSSTAVPAIQPVQAGTPDTDGDHDGSKAAAPVAAPVPPTPNPTATLGNHLDTHA